MIDYKKLKLLHEEAFKYAKDHNTFMDVQMNFHSDESCGLCLKWFRNTDTHEYNCDIDDIDRLLTDFSEITKQVHLPETKYKINQLVWRLNDECQPHQLRIIDIDYNSDEMYLDDHDNWWNEEKLYLTRNTLIEEQLKYWEGLKI